MNTSSSRGRLWRSRWAAIGAAVAVTFGAGGLAAVNAAGGVDSTTVLTDPVRVLDSRDPLDVGLAGPFASQLSQKLNVTGSIPTTTGSKTVVPAGATGVLLNVTVVGATANGFISIRPGDATGAPATSSLNFTAGQVVPNAVLVALPTTGTNAGKIDITYDAYGVTGPTTDILIDVVGYTSDSKLDALQAEVDAVEAMNATQQTQIDSLLAPPAGPGVLQLPASSFQPSVVGAGGDQYYRWTPTYNVWTVVTPAPTTLCYFTEAELPQGASFDLLKASYATDGSAGGTVTLYRSNGGYGSDPAVSVAELTLPAPVSGPLEAETGSFSEPAVVADDVYLVVVCLGWSRAFTEVQIQYTVPA